MAGSDEETEAPDEATSMRPRTRSSRDARAMKTDVPFPRGCIRIAKRAMLAAEALQRAALLRVRAHLENARDPCARALIDADRWKELAALALEENRILRARIEALPPRERPHYLPEDRFAILSLKARTGWTIDETGRRFVVSGATIATWTRRLDEDGKDALVKTRVPVNRHSDRTALHVKEMHAAAPTIGKRKTAAMLARAGMQIAASTVQRLRRRTVRAAPPPTKPSTKKETAQPRVVTAKHPHHVWHVDITAVATSGGLSLPWLPFALFLLWPFAWHVVVVVDHFSRGFLAFGVFKKGPTSDDVARVLDRAREKAGRAPKHIVSDRGSQFLGGAYDAWCEKHGVSQRYGAIGKHGSIAVVERFIRSLKYEHMFRVLVPFSKASFVATLASYQGWFNEHRPHETLGGQTPRERLDGRAPRRRRYEPRHRYPIPRRERKRVRRGAIKLVALRRRASTAARHRAARKRVARSEFLRS